MQTAEHSFPLLQATMATALTPHYPIMTSSCAIFLMASITDMAISTTAIEMETLDSYHDGNNYCNSHLPKKAITITSIPDLTGPILAATPSCLASCPAYCTFEWFGCLFKTGSHRSPNGAVYRSAPGSAMALKSLLPIDHNLFYRQYAFQGVCVFLFPNIGHCCSHATRRFFSCSTPEYHIASPPDVGMLRKLCAYRCF